MWFADPDKYALHNPVIFESILPNSDKKDLLIMKNFMIQIYYNQL